MTEQDAPSTVTVAEPTVEGWYRTRDSANWMLFSLYGEQWHAHSVDGFSTPCVWGYIEQAGPVGLVAAFPREQVP